ncbi:hypothetical protein MASSI9I_50520 [Massilia sp. 9I]|nr:hypothetical protein MASSI9I_50520 [Massilia sp. 9I]
MTGRAQAHLPPKGHYPQTLRQKGLVRERQRTARPAHTLESGPAHTGPTEGAGGACRYLSGTKDRGDTGTRKVSRTPIHCPRIP